MAVAIKGALSGTGADVTASNELKVSATSAVLPTGAASSANQATEIASLASIDSKTPALVSGRQPVDGSAVTQPISAAALPLPAGASTSANQASQITQETAIAASVASIDTKTPAAGAAQPVQEVAASLAVTATGAAAAAVTLTLPAVAAQFHYITMIEIIRYAAAAITGVAAPLLVTTTNLPGNPVLDFQTAGAIGTSERQLWNPSKALKSSTVNTATTIVCPATTGVIWRVNVWYLAAS